MFNNFKDNKSDEIVVAMINKVILKKITNFH